jgi:CubicO group peptidase (beta-lactamase class C family)
VANYLDRPDSMQWARNEYTVQQLIDSFKDRPASFAPGEKSVYSNSNYILLGAIIENVSGLSYGEFLKRRIFDPLGMKSTFCDGSLAGVPRLASAYEPAGIAAGQPDWNRLVVARPYTMTALYAAGGCLSSLEDLAKFNDALRKGTLLSREVLVRSYQPVALNNGALASTSYGGWQLDRINGRRAAMRGGALPGVCTWLLTMPDEDVTVILLTNRTPGQPRCGMLAVRLAGMALGASGL